MAWVRIHDGAIRHPKIVGLIDWKNPFCVWIWGLSYVQEHLTDGVIVKAAVPNSAAMRTARTLIAQGLWREEVDVFIVHDYLDWNDSREVIESKRIDARTRANKSRSRALHVQRTSSSGVVLPVVSLSSSEVEIEGKPQQPPKSSGRNAGRIFLHRWQLDSLIDTLGPHSDDFGLDDWLDALNGRIAHQALPRDPWKFIQAELHAELQRRGLAVAEAKPETPTNKRIAGLMVGGEAFLKRAADRRQS